MPVFIGSNSDDTELKSDRVGFAVSTVNPGSASSGDSYFNNTDKQLKVYNGSDWDSVGAGGGNFQAVASGSLSDGSTVIINTDGTVGIVTQTASNTSSAGISSEYSSTEVWGNVTSSTSTNNNKLVICYRDDNNSSYGTAKVGTVTGTGITFGPASVFNSASVSYISSIYDSANDRVVISYKDGSNNGSGTVKVGTVTGDTISFSGPASVFNSASANYISSIYDSANDRVVISYNEASGGKAIVGDVDPSNNSISFGSTAVFSPVATDITSTYDSTNDRVVISYVNANNNYYTEAIVGEVDAGNNSIGFGSTVVVESSASDYPSAIYDSTSNRVVVSYRKTGVPDHGKSIVGTVDPSDNSISFPSPSVAFETVAGAVQITSAYDTNANRVVLAYRYNGSPWNGRAIAGTVDPSDNSIGFGNTVIFYSPTEIWEPSATYDSTSEKVVIFYTAGITPASAITDRQGRASLFSAKTQTTNLTSSNFIGFSGGAYTNGQTAKIQIAGSIDDSQVGLTTGQKYFVQNDGTLSTSAGSPSVEAGTAISNTKIIVRK